MKITIERNGKTKSFDVPPEAESIFRSAIVNGQSAYSEDIDELPENLPGVNLLEKILGFLDDFEYEPTKLSDEDE